MPANINSLIISQASAEPTIADRFLVMQTSNGEWDLPWSGDDIGHYGGSELWQHVDPTAPPTHHQRLDPEADLPFTASQYAWVSWHGLQGVLEYKSDAYRGTIIELCDQTSGDNPMPPAGIVDASLLSVVVIKPDAHAKNLSDEITERIRRAGLDMVATVADRQLTITDVEQIWTPPTRWQVPQQPTDWWHETVYYMCERPVTAHLIGGIAVSNTLKQMKIDLRAEYGSDPHTLRERPVRERVRSLMHCSDRTEELLRNACLFWSAARLRQATETTYDVS